LSRQKKAADSSPKRIDGLVQAWKLEPFNRKLEATVEISDRSDQSRELKLCF